jgi:type II secretory pathway component PulF
MLTVVASVVVALVVVAVPMRFLVPPLVTIYLGTGPPACLSAKALITSSIMKVNTVVR